ncbi:ADP-ribosyltransferase [Lactococcus garvieae]|uniref:ADP-ribosyltransferase n=1 Tax=Lactococcus garvieae TaxID=1363 RepID=UPI00398EAA38
MKIQKKVGVILVSFLCLSSGIICSNVNADRVNEKNDNYKITYDNTSITQEANQTNERLTDNEKIEIEKYLNDESNIKTNFMPYNYSDFAQLLPNVRESISIISNAFEKIRLTEQTIGYKEVDPVYLGFNYDLFDENNIIPENYNKFVTQFKGKILPFKEYIDANLNYPTESKDNQNIIIKIEVPKGTSGGIFLDKNQYKLLLNHNYQFYVNEIKEVKINDKTKIQITTSLRDAKDYKNDYNNNGQIWGKETYNGWANSLYPEQKNAIKSYVYDNYSEVNSYLRNEETGNERLEEQIKNISKALTQHKSPEAMIVYRRTGGGEFGITDNFSLGEVDKLLVNKVFEQKGYESTSIQSNLTSIFDTSKYIIRFSVPFGSNVGYLPTITDDMKKLSPYYNDFEKEMLFDKGIKYRVNSVEQIMVNEKEKIVVNAEMLTTP